MGPSSPCPAGLCAGLQGAHGVWQRSLQTSRGPWCGRDHMPSGSWRRRLSGQEESPKGCTGEKDQVHPGRPERGEVKWGTQVTVIRAPNEREQPRGALLPGGLELERRHSWRMLSVQTSVGRRERVCVCVHVCALCAHTPTRVHVFVGARACVHVCAFVRLWTRVPVCLCVDLGPERMSDSCNVTQSPGKWKRWQVRVPRY